MNVVDRAFTTFRKEPFRYNCAQTICDAVGRQDLLAAMSGFGQGRAPEGLCGALYAALQCAPEEKREALLKKFTDKLGHTKCKDLKMQGKVDCHTCVATAALLADGQEA